MNAERVLWSICVPRLVSIAQAVFFLERGQADRQTDKQTEATERPTHAGGGRRGQQNTVGDGTVPPPGDLDRTTLSDVPLEATSGELDEAYASYLIRAYSLHYMET